MRVLCLLRGAPGSGKSTWLEENNLTKYTLCTDTFRLLLASPKYNELGELTIDQNQNHKAWEMLYTFLEKRMQNGEFTIIDAVHSKTSEMKKYRELATKYRYRIYVIDFTDIPLAEVIRRNQTREEYKRVNKDVVENIYARFATQSLPSGFKLIHRDQFDEVLYKKHDFNNYKKIIHFGDIHGCLEPIQEYFNTNPFDINNLYIFVGDYIDRGIQNKEVLEFLFTLMDKDNVIFLEGNHERFIGQYLGYFNLEEKSKFYEETLPQLQNIDKEKLKVFYRKLSQAIYYTYSGKDVIVTHAGIPAIGENIIFTATKDFINGVGKYRDTDKIYQSFENEDKIQIHGHRNSLGHSIKASSNSFNLEGQIEYGGHLRIVELEKENPFYKNVEIKNNTFNTKLIEVTKEVPIYDVERLIKALRNSPLIREKTFGEIASFNFTRDAFSTRAWNSLSELARGLFINIKTNKIALRSWKKFFNLNEVEETLYENILKRDDFPFQVFAKYNGFLGMLSYDKDSKDFIFATKSSLEGPFSEWFKEIFYKTVNLETQERLKKWLSKRNRTFIFEVVDMENDPHIIDERINKLSRDIILLDIITNEIDPSRESYDSLLEIAREFNLNVKYKVADLMNKEELENFLKNSYYMNREDIEGYVIESTTNFMFKIKLEFYSFWKHMRSVASAVLSKGYYKHTGSLLTKEANMFYGFVQELYKNNYDGEKDIITLRDKFYREKLVE